MPTTERVRMLNGYRVIFKPEYKKSMTSANWKGFVYEHIYVAEENFGREIRSSEVVHHLDGDRSNNKVENLIILERSQHTKLHKWLEQQGVSTNESGTENGVNSTNSEAEEHRRFCLSCGTTLQRTQKKYCCVECVPRDRVSEKPNKETLIELLNDKHSFSSIGRVYGVSGNAVKKWLIKYGLYTRTLSQASSTLLEGAETSGGV